MSAFNWLEFEDVCPICGRMSIIRAQFHVAASFDGDDRRRFSGVTYQIRQELHWWRDEGRKALWLEKGVPIPGQTNAVRECCYASCVSGHKLYTVVEFRDLRPEKVIDIGPEENWPSNYSR